MHICGFRGDELIHHSSLWLYLWTHDWRPFLGDLTPLLKNHYQHMGSISATQFLLHAICVYKVNLLLFLFLTFSHLSGDTGSNYNTILCSFQCRSLLKKIIKSYLHFQLFLETAVARKMLFHKRQGTTTKQSTTNPLHTYHQTSKISCTKSQNLYIFRLLLQLSLSNSLKPGVKLRVMM